MNKKLFSIAYTIYFAFIVRYFCVNYGNPLEFFVEKTNSMTDTEQVLWVMMFLPVWGFSYFQSDQELSIGKMAMYRFQKISHWWKRMQLNNLVRLSATYLGMMVAIGVFNKSAISVNAWITLLLHALFLYEIGIIIWLLSKKITLSAIIVILLEGVGYRLVNTYGVSPCYYPFSWGMYGFSRLQYGKDGYLISLATLIQIVIVLITVFIFDLKLCGNSGVEYIFKITDNQE